MSEEQQNLPYRYDRILIESDDILTPSFAGSTVVLSGAQIELLRNVVHYLDRRSTFVEKYNTLNYTTPDNDNWDDISQIVADLEERLMGDLNTIWGYDDRLFTQEDDTVTVGTTEVQSHTAVPADYVHRVTGYSLWSDKTVPSVVVFANFGGISIAIGGPFALTANVYTVVAPFDATLKEDDYILVSWAGLSVPQRVISNVWGYSMVV